MPKVGTKKFPYTAKGKKAAAAYKKKKPKKKMGGGPVYRKKGSTKKGELKGPIDELKGPIDEYHRFMNEVKVQEMKKKPKKKMGGGPVRRMSKGGKLVKGPNS